MSSLWEFLSQSPVVGPVATVLGGAIGVAGKVYLDRRKARREDAAHNLAAAELANDRAEQALSDRAADRQQATIEALMTGFAEMREQISDNHRMTLAQLGDERARLERLADNAIRALDARATRPVGGKG